MLYTFFKFGALDLETAFILTVIFLFLLFVFRFVKKEKVLSVILCIFAVVVLIGEILYRKKKVSMLGAFYILVLEYVMVPGILAAGAWLMIRKIKKKK